MLKKDKALCIRAVDYSETSQILTFFTRDNGKIAAIAKGAKRPKSSFGGSVEILSYGDIVFSENVRDCLATLTEFNQLPLFPNLRKNLLVLNCALLAVELLNTLTQQADGDRQLFDGIIEFLRSVQNSRSRQSTLTLLILFQFNLLSQTGILPVLQGCSNCRMPFNDNWRQYYFSSKGNGIICHDCHGSFPDRIVLAPVVARCLNDFNYIQDVGTETLEKIEQLLIHHFTEISGRCPKMAKSILDMFRPGL